LVLVHEFGHFIVAKCLGVRVEKFSFGFGPKIVSIKKKDTEYLISLIPLGGYVKMAGDEPGEARLHEPWEFLSRSAGDRFKIIFAGPLLNYILGFLVFSVIFMFGSPTLTTEVGSLLKGYPAEKSGISAGDRIISVDGKTVKYWEDMTEIIHKKVDGPLKLLVERNSRRIEMTIQPAVRETKDIFGAKIRIALIGIAPSQKIENLKYGPVQAFYKGFQKLIRLTVMTYKALFSVMIGRLSLKESMTGPIGIFVITGQAAKLGIIYILHLMGILSASLAIFNLLPLPVLDGGHIIFLAVEKIRRRPISAKVQEAITNAGIAFLVLLTVLIFYNDMTKFGFFEKAGEMARTVGRK
jgi:regulator of sigma E protease